MVRWVFIASLRSISPGSWSTFETSFDSRPGERMHSRKMRLASAHRLPSVRCRRRVATVVSSDSRLLLACPFPRPNGGIEREPTTTADLCYYRTAATPYAPMRLGLWLPLPGGLFFSIATPWHDVSFVLLSLPQNRSKESLKEEGGRRRRRNWFLRKRSIINFYRVVNTRFWCYL